jgi:hypothetical protein
MSLSRRVFPPLTVKAGGDDDDEGAYREARVPFVFEASA